MIIEIISELVELGGATVVSEVDVIVWFGPHVLLQLHLFKCKQNFLLLLLKTVVVYDFYLL